MPNVALKILSSQYIKKCTFQSCETMEIGRRMDQSLEVRPSLDLLDFLGLIHPRFDTFLALFPAFV